MTRQMSDDSKSSNSTVGYTHKECNSSSKVSWHFRFYWEAVKNVILPKGRLCKRNSKTDYRSLENAIFMMFLRAKGAKMRTAWRLFQVHFGGGFIDFVATTAMNRKPVHSLLKIIALRVPVCARLHSQILH